MSTLQDKNKTVRNSNFELLRIIVMLLIVCGHFGGHSFGFSQGFDLAKEPLVNQWVVGSMKIWGKFGVAVFVMITGYFMCNKPFRFKRFFLVAFQTSFYATVIYSAFVLLGKQSFSLTTLVKSLLCFVTGEYWFVPAYLCLLLLSPLLNLLIQKTDGKQLFIILSVVYLLFFVLLTFFPIDLTGKKLLKLADYCISFSFYYLLSAWIRLYAGNKIKVRYDVLLLTVTVAVIILAARLQDKVVVTGLNSFLVAIGAACCILIAKKSKPFRSKTVNLLAKGAFGVYLIHDNGLIRAVLWPIICRNGDYVQSPMLIPHMIVCVLSVYLVCAAIDLARLYAIEQPVATLYDKVYELCLPIRKKVGDCVEKTFKKITK